MPLDYPIAEYFTGAKLRLTIRLDEFGDTTRLKPAPAKSTKNLTGIADPRGALSVIQDPAAQGVTRYLLVQQGASNAGAATSQARSSDGLTYDVTVIPKDMTWDQNGIRMADTLSATIKFIDCPIDPRCARSIAVEAFYGTVSEDEYFAGIQGGVRTGASAQSGSDSLNIIPDTYLDQNRTQRTNSRFVGWVDKWNVEWQDEQEPLIRLDCRDNTQLLIEQEASPRFLIAANIRMDQAIANFLANYVQFQGLSVQYLPTTDKPPVLHDVLLNTACVPKVGPQVSKSGSTDKLSVWDYLTDICGSVGHIIRVAGTLLIIQRPRSVTEGNPVARPDDPFQGRTLNTGEQLTYRRMLYGRNIKSMSVTRAYAKTTPANVEARCQSTESKKMLVARFPLPKDRLKYALPGDAQPDQKWMVKVVYGIKDLQLLQQIAQGIYEQQGRNELQCEIKTMNLASFGGANLDPDILDMQVGDCFEVLVNRTEDEVATLTFMEKVMTVQAKNAVFLQTLGFAPDFAKAYAKSFTDAGFKPQWRLKNMKVIWGIDKGIEISLTGQNYIEVRANKSLDAGQEPSTQSTTAPQIAPAHAPIPIASTVANAQGAGRGSINPTAEDTAASIGPSNVPSGSGFL